MDRAGETVPMMVSTGLNPPGIQLPSLIRRFAVTKVEISSPRGVARIEVLSVGGTGGPMGPSAVSFGRNCQP